MGNTTNSCINNIYILIKIIDSWCGTLDPSEEVKITDEFGHPIAQCKIFLINFSQGTNSHEYKNERLFIKN